MLASREMLHGEKQGFVQVTQDGIVRLFYDKTPSNIQGLYTEDIETCIAIVIVGTKGISLIHDSGRLTTQNILNEFTLQSPIKCWSLGYNPRRYKNGLNDAYCKEKVDRFSKKLVNILARDKVEPKSIVLKDGFLAVDRSGETFVAKKPLSILPPYDYKLRVRINQINSYFLCVEIREELTPDFQYDGLEWQDIPSLNKSAEDVLVLSKLPRFQNSELFSRALATHEILCNEIETRARANIGFVPNIHEMAAKINAKYNTTALEQRLTLVQSQLQQEVEAPLNHLDHQQRFIDNIHLVLNQYLGQSKNDLLMEKFVQGALDAFNKPGSSDQRYTQLANYLKVAENAKFSKENCPTLRKEIFACMVQYNDGNKQLKQKQSTQTEVKPIESSKNYVNKKQGKRR